jgi:hypothetical protein
MFPFQIIPFFLLISSAFAAAPSGETWFTLKTANFRVHHTANLENYARRMAFSLERALPKLEERLNWKAPTPLDVIVLDPSDSANGLAANFPNTRMELFATPFESDSSLAHYEDWVNELAIHELTHIIANDGGLGAYKTLRSIFGSWVKPNGLQPLWMIEGLAVYMETSLTIGGRGRSPLMNAMLREAATKGSVAESFPLHRMNDGIRWWPGGATPYFLGYALQASTIAYDPNLPGKLSYQNSGLIPFQPNKNLERLIEKDWETLWQESSQKIALRYSSNKKPEICFLTQSGKSTGGQAISGDGWIYFSEENWDHGYYLSRVSQNAPCGNLEIERLFRKDNGGPSQVAVSRDNSKVVFSVFENSSFERFFSDLYLWNPSTKENIQITTGLRARDPAFLQERLFFIYQKADTTQWIAEWDWQNKAAIDFFGAKPMERISGLAASSDGLAFSIHKNEGKEEIYFLSPSSKEISKLTTNPQAKAHFDRNPYFDSQGNLYFSRSEISDTNSLSKQFVMVKKINEQTSQQISLGEISYLDRPISLEKNGFLVTTYSERGLDIARVSAAENKGVEKKAETDLHEFFTGEKAAKAAPPSLEQLSSVGEVEPYRALKSPATSIWPQYWIPEFSGAEEGYLLGASTSGNDPLEYHRWGASAQYDSRAKFPLYRAFYQNRSYPTSFYIEAKQSNSYFRSSNSSNRSAQYSGSAIIPIHPVFLTLGAAFQEKTLFGRKTQSGILFQSLNYQEVGKTPSALDPNHGESLSLYSGIYPNSKGERLFADLRPKANFYFRGISPSHSIAIQAKAGITTNKLLASNYYLGGGASALNGSDFVVRGYPIDSLFGQRIVATNLVYSLPLAHPYWGWGTNPLFVKTLGLRLLSDFGSANFTANYKNETFQFYQPTKVGRKILAGFGVDFVASGSIFYHVPVSMVLGLHYGPQKFAGGGFLGYFGINAGEFGTLGN